MTLVHELPPVHNADSKVLILGSFPSPRSRTDGFYYAHPQNRFWPVLAALFSEEVPQAAAARRAFALRHRIALWDVIHSCDIENASDQSIKNAVPNDVPALLKSCPIGAIFTTGGKAAALYRKLLLPDTGVEAHALPSTSPANCAMGFDILLARYSVIKEALET